jgi:hypothetical protein
VVDDEPLGLVVEEPEPVALPDGVDDEPVVPVAEPEPLVLLPGVVVLPGEADGVLRSGVLPTRSDSVRLQAAVVPTSNARAQRPDSILFIVDCPPCGVFDQETGVQRTCP